MRKVMSAVAAFATAATAVVAMSGAAQAGDDTVYGCRSGNVCIWAQGVEPFDDPHPTVQYSSYGYHNLRNQYGEHAVLNNQYGGATAHLCYNYGGTNCPEILLQDDWSYENLTPINSITLDRP
ncbi:hypothetical protein [Streptomyces sp. NRRL B-3229]|uniref:hypothetical protein n=1 Tax=Streptomyces sp. NRRL B-3229 TaxID=1463836 RepID=UPI0004BEEF9B|nr:hypothetical protein [Streptomyces sp. NRRL B-3229]